MKEHINISKEDFKNALDHLPVNFANDRGLWLSTIAAVHYACQHEGIPLEEGKEMARAWSQTTTAGNYTPEGFEKAWNSFKEAGNVATTGFIIKHALANGFRFSGVKDYPGSVEEAFKKDYPNGAPDINGMTIDLSSIVKGAEKPTLPAGIKTFNIGDTIDLKGLDPTPATTPREDDKEYAITSTPADMTDLNTQFGEIFKYLDMYKPDEKVNIVYNVKWGDDGEPTSTPGTGLTLTVSKWKEVLNAEKVTGRKPFSTYSAEGYDDRFGVWIRINPLDGKGISDKNVRFFRYALLESDEVDKATQLDLLKKMGAPYRMIVDSGNKSLHAIVKVDAANAKDYAAKVARLYAVAESVGLVPDKQDKNPSRLTRLPGIRRGNGWQKIVYEGNPGKLNSFNDWDTTLMFGAPVDPATGWDEWDPEKELAPVLIDGILRQGHKLLITGPSKAGKSFGLIELAAALVSGGYWWGKRCKKTKTVYINFEIDGKSFVNRVHNVFSAMQVRPEPGMLTIFNLRGKPAEVNNFVKHVSSFCEGKDIGAIIIDPIYKLMLGDDENSAKDIGQLCSSFDRLAANIGASVIYCHHYSKGSAYNKGFMEVADRGSGSGVFGRDADAIISLTQLAYDAPENNPDETAWIVESVLREFRVIKPFYMYFDYPIHLLDATGSLAELRLKGDPTTIGAKRRGLELEEKTKDNLLTLSNQLRALFYSHEGDSLREMKDDRTCIHVTKVMDKYGYSRQYVYRYIKKLVEFEIHNGYIYAKP